VRRSSRLLLAKEELVKKKISVEALADIIAPGKRGEVRSVRVDALRSRAEKMLGSAYDVIVLTCGLKGKIIPAALLKAE
jgi:hypothetical protein